jgi:hypothetical protein
VPGDGFARRREGDRPLLPRPVEQPGADDPLDGGDLLADRGLRVAEPLCGRVEGGLFGDCQERGQVAKLQPRPPVRARVQVELH